MLGIQAVRSTLLRTGAWAIAISILANTAVASARVMPPPRGDASARAELAGCALGRSEPFSSSATVGTQSATSRQSLQSGDGKAEAGAPRPPEQSSTNPDVVGQNELVTLPAGTVISVRLADTVKSNHSHTCDRFSGHRRSLGADRPQDNDPTGHRGARAHGEG